MELCKLQEWVKQKGLRIIVLFEGRDGAGKGGAIKAITERVSPRVFRVVALPAPSDREKSQMYVQRYVSHFPAAGEIVIFDRSWYNRAGVEYVMGFCTEEQRQRFLTLCPVVESFIASSGILLFKYWLEVSNEEQERRFNAVFWIRCVNGSSVPLTCLLVRVGTTTREHATCCFTQPTRMPRHGTLSDRTTRSALA